MTISELEDFFGSIELPKTVSLNKAVRINDTKQFLEVNFLRLKGFNGDLERNPSYWHLCELKEVLETS